MQRKKGMLAEIKTLSVLTFDRCIPFQPVFQ
jgi:hypothetical protein